MHDDQMLPALNGARVLVVQNDPFIAADLDLMIDDAGGKVVALAASRDDALFLLGREPIDAAVVDPNLGDAEAASLIKVLNRREIPLVIYPPSSSTQASSAQCSPWAWGIVAALSIALKLMPALEQAQFLL
jgi:chemotaxis response regulator CheB